VNSYAVRKVHLQNKELKMVWGKLMGHEENPEDRALAEAGIMLSMADGMIEDEEIDDLVVSIFRHPKMQRLGERTIVRILNNAVRDVEKQGIDARIRWIASQLPNVSQRLDAIGIALSVSMSDGTIEAEEVAILQKMQRAFGLSDEQIEAIMQQYR
jgi:tellurite resistance protein